MMEFTMKDSLDDVPAFECEDSENTPISDHCEGWGNCKAAGKCLLTEAIEQDAESMSRYLDWEREAYNRELEEESLGRPLFPNEY